MSEYLNNRLNYYIDSLNRFIKSARPLMLIIGQQGSGKKELLYEFIQQLLPECKTINIVGNNDFEPQQLVDIFCEEWHLTRDPHLSSQRQQLDELLTQLRDQKKHFILIVRDAHQLNISTLAAISHLAGRQESTPIALHIIIAGEMELEDKIASLMAQIPPSLLLQPLTKKETSHYIRYRLSKLRKTDPIVPSQEIIDDIYQQSGGFPSIINHLTQKWLYHHILEDDKSALPISDSTLILSPSRARMTTNTTWQKHGVKLIASSCLLVLGIGIWIFNHKDMLNTLLMHKSQTLMMTQKTATPPRVSVTIVKKSENLTMQNSITPKNQVTVVESAATSNIENPIATADTIAAPKSPVTAATTEPSTAEIEQPTIVTPEENSSEDASSTASTTLEDIPSESLALDQPVPIDTSKSKLQNVALKEAYVIQLFAAPDLDAAKEFIAKRHIESSAKIRKIQKNGQAWYTVTLGKFTNYKKATAYALHLSEDLKKERPWVRKL